jgi:hypothetical protein
VPPRASRASPAPRADPARRVRDAVVYHSPERMGYSVAGSREPYFLTNKRVSRGALGTRVWLITGEGRPRRYWLRGTFTVASLESGDDEGFRLRVRGRGARWLSPMVDLTDAEWFDAFRRSQGSFAFGFQGIADARFVRALERALERALAAGRVEGRTERTERIEGRA